MSVRGAAFWCHAVVVAAGCAPAPEDTDPVPTCVDALERSPETIDDVVAAIATLPAPVSLPCFLQALPRPLGVEATADVFSVQPAVSAASPRLFVVTDTLTLAVVPEGPDRHLLEMGERVPGDPRTRKGELVFPVEPPLDPAYPYDHVRSAFGDGTSCGVCHPREAEVSPGVLASAPLRPIDSSLVDIDWLADQAAACDPQAEPDRCAILSAVFDHGAVDHRPFPTSWRTIYD